jgi:hypothetical protein
MKKIILILISLFISTVASAATWNVSNVLHGVDSGFGYSGLHDASGANVMSGPELAKITSASGTYDDTSGAVNFLFSLDNGDSLGLIGNLLFNGAGLLNSNSFLAYTGLNNLSGISSTGNFGFKTGDVCCSGSYDPNSFKPTPNNLNFLTLWGADGFDNGDYISSTVGMDFRLALTPSAVPLPAAIWLFAPAMGIIGMRRKKAGVTTV